MIVIVSDAIPSTPNEVPKLVGRLVKIKELSSKLSLDRLVNEE